MMLNKYILIKIIVLFLMPNFILGQTDIKLSSLYLNPLTYNPAYAGSFEGMSFSSFYSSQWLGFDGAAKTIFVNGHGTVLGSNTGLGLELIRDEIGGSSETKILGNYAYHIKLNGNWRLSMGLKAGVSYSSVDYSKLNIENLNEFNSLNNRVNSMNVNIGSGFYLYNNNFFLGLGIPNLFKTKTIDGYKNTLANTTQNYYFTLGYNIQLDEGINFKPSILSRVVAGAPINTLLSASLDWHEKFYLSLNLDLNSTIGAFTGFRFLEQYMIGYSYDTSINNFSRENYGIHSLFLNIRFKDFWGRERCGCYTF